MPRRGARRRARGDGERVLARRRFTPLTVTDRLTAEPPAFGVALAHVWPSRARRRRGGGRGRGAAVGGARDPRTARPTRRSGSAPDGPRVVEVAARLGGGHDAELCRGGARRRPERAGARRRARAERDLVTVCRKVLRPPAARASSSSSRREGELAAVARRRGGAARSRGVLDVLVYRRPGHVFGPLGRRRARDRAGAIARVDAAASRGEASRARRAGAASVPARRTCAALDAESRGSGRLRTRSALTRRDGDGLAGSASSRPRSATRRSRPSPRRSAPAG